MAIAVFEAYRSALEPPGVKRLVIAQLGCYLLTGVVGLALMLCARDVTGSYAMAGAVSAGYALAVAAAAPLWGRAVDARGPRSILAVTATVQACGLTAYVVAAAAPGWSLVVCAAVAGIGTPPVNAICSRLLVKRPDEAHRRTLFAMSGLFAECVYVISPLVVGSMVFLFDALYAVALTAPACLAGVLFFRSSPILDTMAPHHPSERRSGARLNSRQAAVLAIVVLGAFAIGAVQVGVIAHAERVEANSGLFIACLAVGGVVASLLYGARRFPGSLPTQLGVCLGLYGLTILLLVPAPTPALAVAALVVIGFCTGPADAIEALLIGQHTPPQRQTQAFATLVTANWIGFAVGSAATGALIERTSASTGPILAAAAALVAALTALCSRRLQPTRSG